METKEMKIVVPEGYEIDKENSTFECIKFKPKLTYEDALKPLENDSYYDIQFKAYNRRQVAKLMAINKLMNVAKYLNKNWKPNWDDINDYKSYLGIEEEEIYVNETNTCNEGQIYFKCPELAQQAINILGEDTIRLALSTDW